jgi:hypothetical protein
VAERARAEQILRSWVNSNLWRLLPASSPGPHEGPKPGIISDWFVHPNNYPSEQYVLSPAGTIDKRLRTDQTGISNLFIAGDWIRTGSDSGAFETAVMAGLQCSRAVCGYPRKVFGETDFP